MRNWTEKYLEEVHLIEDTWQDVQKALDIHATEFFKEPNNSGYAYDLNHVRHLLEEITRFLTNADED